MEKRNLPVGVFDSGVGGISVLREMVRELPREDFYFFGDSLHAPYGTKTMDEVRRLTLENVVRMREYGIKAIVVACNTATSAAISRLRELYTEMPVVGIEPALKPAVLEKENAHVLVMATQATVKANKFRELLARFEEQAEVTPVGCPGLMEFVEAGTLEGPKLEAYLRELLAPYLAMEIDAVVLGCTHYPFVKKTIQKVLGPGPHLIDGSRGTARELKRRLEREDLLTDRPGPGKVTFEESMPEKIALCKYLLAQPLDEA